MICMCMMTAVCLLIFDNDNDVIVVYAAQSLMKLCASYPIVRPAVKVDQARRSGVFLSLELFLQCEYGRTHNEDKFTLQCLRALVAQIGPGKRPPIPCPALIHFLGVFHSLFHLHSPTLLLFVVSFQAIHHLNSTLGMNEQGMHKIVEYLPRYKRTRNFPISHVWFFIMSDSRPPCVIQRSDQPWSAVIIMRPRRSIKMRDDGCGAWGIGLLEKPPRA